MLHNKTRLSSLLPLTWGLFILFVNTLHVDLRMDSRHVVQLRHLRGGLLAAFMGFIHRCLDGIGDALYTVVYRIAVLARNRSALSFCRRYGFESTRWLARVLHDSSQFYRLEGVRRRGKLLKCHRIHDLLMTSLLLADLALDHVLCNYRELHEHDGYLGAGVPVLSQGGRGAEGRFQKQG